MSQLYVPRPHQKLGVRFLREHPRCNLFATPGCVDADTEYLSPTGWHRIADYDGRPVAQYWPETGAVDFVENPGYVKESCNTMIRFKTSRGVDQLLSPEHRVLYFADYSGRPKSGPRISHAVDFLLGAVPDSAAFVCTAKAPDGWNLGMTEAQLRVQIAVMADGYFPNKNARVAVRLKKQRKIERLHELLIAAEIEYTCKPCLPTGFVIFHFAAPLRQKVYGSDWWRAGQQELEVIADEIWRWDGSRDSRRTQSKQFFSSIQASADFAQWVFAATDHRTSLSYKTRERRGRTEHEYVVCATQNTTRIRLRGGTRKNNVRVEPSTDGFKYCFTVPSSFLLLRRNGCIFATGNSGKTSMVYSLLSTLKLAGSSFFPALVIAPKAVCELTWPAEREKWTQFQDMRVVQILGDERTRLDGILSWGDVYLINYENLPWLVQQYAGKPWPFRIVIADESTRLKNLKVSARSNLDNITEQGSKRARALAAIAQNTGRWINLTGTPAPNGYQDLWGQQWFVDFGKRLGTSHSQYLKRWFVTDQYTRQTTLRHPSCKDEIDALMADCTLSIRAEDWMDVEAANYVEREVKLPAHAMALYKQMERDFWIEIQQLEARHEVTAVNAAALSQKLLQLSSGAVYNDGKTPTFVHDAKIEALRSIIDELQEPLLVAYWYKFEIPMLQKAFPEFRVFRDQRDEADWNAGNIKLMGVHPQSAGHGVNLQYGGRAMVHFTHTWNAELREQIEARIGPLRQKQAGLNRAVVHYDLLATGTLDRDVRDRVRDKCTLQQALMAAHARYLHEVAA